MGLRYNPFNGSFDFTRSPGSYLDGEVATFADLPLDTAAAPLNSAWLVREGSGLWLLTRKPAGIYIRTATGGTDRNADYTYASAFPDVFSDANLVVYNDADSTKNVKLSAASLTTGTTRTLTVPDKSGTIATTDAGDMATGTLADARLSSNVPLKDAANTFSQNQTLNGTNNVAPNQTAASGSSLMTRDLTDFRNVSRSSDEVWVADDFVFFSNIGWDAGSTGTGASNALGVGTNDHPGIRVMVSGQATGWARTRVRGNAFISASGMQFEMIGIVRLETLANTYAIFGGTTSISDHGGWPVFMYDSSVSANWRVSGGSLGSYVDTGYAATTNWVFLRAWRYATSGNINYEIRATRTGTLHASGTLTDGLNAAPQDFGCVVKVPGGAAAANPGMTIDYISGRAWNINR